MANTYWLKPGETKDEYYKRFPKARPGTADSDLTSKTEGLQDQITNIQNAGEISFDEAPNIATGGDSLPSDALEASGAAKTSLDLFTQIVGNYQNVQTEKKDQQSSVQKAIGAVLGRPQLDVPGEMEKYQERTLEQMGLKMSDMQRIGGLIDKVTGVNQDIATMRQSMMLDMEKSGEMLATQAAVRGSKARKERQWSIKIAGKEAEAGVMALELNMIQGAYDKATSQAWNIVNALTMQERQKVQDLKWVYSTQQDSLNRLDTESRDMFNKIYSEAVREEENTREDYQSKLNLMMSAYKEGINPGWSASYVKGKTLEELTAEIGPKIAARALEAKAGDTITMTDDQVRATTRNIKRDILAENPDASDDEIYQRVLDAITLDPTLTNKDRAFVVIADMFGKTPETTATVTQQGIPGRAPTPTMGTPAGAGLYWTEDGRLLSEEEILKEMRETPGIVSDKKSLEQRTGVEFLYE